MEQNIAWDNQSSNENWLVVRSLVHRRWEEISDEELEATCGEHNAVVDLLASKYHIDSEEAESRFEAALAEEKNDLHAVDEIRRAEIRFETDGGRVVPPMSAGSEMRH